MLLMLLLQPTLANQYAKHVTQTLNEPFYNHIYRSTYKLFMKTFAFKETLCYIVRLCVNDGCNCSITRNNSMMVREPALHSR